MTCGRKTVGRSAGKVLGEGVGDEDGAYNPSFFPFSHFDVPPA
ncbi:MAG: hypothetical protein QW467_02650 [Candidatus Caldarchaeum sp.]